MKSIFTKLSTLLLCGAVAMVSCTDFSEDIQNLDNKVDNLGNTTQTELATLQKAITDLEAKLSAQYATKEYVDGLNATLKTDLEGKIAGLSEGLAEVKADLKDAKDQINGAIADLDSKKADKTAVDAAVKTATDAIAALKADLEAAKGDLEDEIAAVKEQIADAQEQLNSKIDGVDAKANELHNTILALSDYLKTLEARVNELKGTLDALSEYLPTIEAKVAELKGTLDALSDHLEGREAEVDAKLNELHTTLLALSDHLEEYEATTDFKLVELKGSLDALSVYLEEYEASVDAKFKEILNTFDSLDGFLDEKFAALEATDTDLYKEIDGIRVVLTALNNLLTDEAAARMEEDNALYELIGTSVTALNNLIADLEATDTDLYKEIDGVRQAFTTLNNLLDDEIADRTAEDAAIYELIGTSVTALNNLIADLEAEDDAIYVEMENIRTYIAQVYNSLSYEIQAVDAALKAHIAAFEAYKAQMKETVENLYKNDDAISKRLAMHTDKLAKIIDAKVAELQAADEEIWTKINSLEESLSQAINYLLAEMEDKDEALYTKISEETAAKFEVVEEAVSSLYFQVADLQTEVAELANQVLDNAAAIAKLETAVEILNSWAEAHQDEYDDLVQLVTKHVADLTAQIEALNEKDLELEANIGETSKALSALIEDTEKRFGEIEVYIKENFALQGAAIRNLENILNDLSAELGARLDALEDRMDAAEVKIADLEDQAAEMSEAIENIEAAIEDLEAMDEALAAEIANVDAAAKKALKEAREELQDQIDALVKAKEALEARVKVLEELVADNTANIENNRKEIEANITAISNAVKQLGSLQATVNDMIQSSAIINSALQAKDIELQKNIDAAVADLAAAVARIGAVEDAVKALQELAETLATKAELKDEVAKIEKKMTDIQNMLLTLITASEDRANDKINHLRELVSEADELIKELRGDVNDLLARVQSLVYVPDYDDHKATISWAELYGEESYGILVKKSVLRYRVYAKADEDAVAAAKAIETAWTPETFYYEVEPVKRAWTRSATVPASLEITDVWAEGEYLNVEVLAKNFNPEFFYWYGDNYPGVIRENRPEEGKPADEKNAYSVSLVLSDGNNNRSTEYTNLVPARPEWVEAIIIDGTEAKKEITYMTNPESENVNLLPYDLDPAPVVVLKDHELRFRVNEEESISLAELRNLGYEVPVTRSIKEMNHENVFVNYITYNLTYQNIWKMKDVKDAETGKWNTEVTLTEPMTKDAYLALKEAGENTLVLRYNYDVNGVNVWAESSVEICNRLVNINFEVDVPWTLETALSTIADSKMYEGPVAATFEYDLAEAVENGKPLEGYSLYSIIHATGITTSYAPKCPISLSVNDETITATLKHGSARYAFPVNNNDDVVDYNQYVVTKRADFEDITFTVTLKMNLLEQAPHQYLEKDVTFTTEAGANGWLFGYWNALEDAYQKFLADGYIGYVDAPETGKAKFFEAFAQTSSYGNMGDMPVVNGETGIPQNVNIPFTANNNEAGEHKFQLWHEQLGLTPEQPYVDGTQHTILQSVKPYFQIPFTFTVNGTVDLPDYALDLDPVRVLNRGNEKIVNVYGEISKETNKYTVDVSDLAKYYYVVNKEGTKSLVNANDDVVTVDFTLSPMAGAEETGYNFNAVADDTDYTLTVDWTKAEPYILPMSEAVVNWGTYPHTEVGVNAILNVNGFPIVAKPITLVTADPLEIALNDVTVEVTHLSGTNAEPIVAKVYQNFVLTSAVEEGNLFNNNAKTIGGLWYYSKADNTYGVTMDLKFNRVYYKENNEKVGWDESKIVLEKYTAENVVAPYEVGDLTGNVWIRPDDGDIQVPIYVEFDVVMNHRIHDASKTTCETKGTVTVKFVPEGYVEVAE